MTPLPASWAAETVQADLPLVTHYRLLHAGWADTAVGPLPVRPTETVASSEPGLAGTAACLAVS